MKTFHSYLPYLLLAVCASAQTPTATVVGRVIDPTGAAVDAATVRIRNVDTNEARTVARAGRLPAAVSSTNCQPFTPQLSGPSNDLAQATRPDRIANGALPNPSPDMWFDVAAFPIVPDSAYRYGNSGRNILDGPGTVAVNLAASRFFRIGEKSRMQMRWETFNTTNHSNLSLPAVNLDKSNAGTITKAKAARVMQLGLRYEF